MEQLTAQQLPAPLMPARCTGQLPFCPCSLKCDSACTGAKEGGWNVPLRAPASCCGDTPRLRLKRPFARSWSKGGSCWSC